MAPRTLPTIVIFSAIALALAAVAAVLPSSESRREIRDLRIEYGAERESAIVTPEEESIFDFLKFELNPTTLDPISKIIRSRQPSNKKILIQEGAIENELIRSSADSVVVLADNSEELNKESQQFLAHELSIREAAITSGVPEDCDVIGNEHATENCRGEIYFQKAIAAKDLELCEQIEVPELQLRCENYLNLISQDETVE